MAEKLKKVLVFDSNKCTGCRICEFTCSMGHFEEFNPQKSHIKILKNKEMDLNIACLEINHDF
jgi:Fe-S-cluster-containing hydrogenase component 2